MTQFARKVVVLVAFIAMAMFGQAVAVEKVAPLGFEVGKATLASVRAGVQGAVDGGTNKYSGGPMLKSDGKGFGVDGLNEVTFIFDQGNVLCGVLMEMGKNRFDDIYGFLAGKYKVAEKRIPFVGDKYARFKVGKVTIDVNAPHLSFEMTVNYLTDDMLKTYKETQRRENEAKEKSEKANF